ERPREIVIWKTREKSGEFDFVGRETVPPVAITVVDNSAGAENLLHACDVLARHADHHMRELGKAERLLHNRPHGDIARVFFREAQRDVFRERHAEGMIRSSAELRETVAHAVAENLAVNGLAFEGGFRGFHN